MLDRQASIKRPQDQYIFLIYLGTMLAPKMDSKRSSKSILSFVSMILNGLGLNFHVFWSFFHDLEWFWVPILEYLALWRVSGLPLGHPGVPWGARVPPTRVQGEKSGFVGSPLASQNEVILVSIFYDFCNERYIDFRLKFDKLFKPKMIPK